MNTLEIAYKILYSLEHEKKADYMGVLISPEKLKCSEEKWLEVIRSLLDDGLIAGVRIGENIIGEPIVDIKDTRITLKGAQYLKENSTMAQFGKVATNAITIVSGAIAEAVSGKVIK